jgi:hypothetical protein
MVLTPQGVGRVGRREGFFISRGFEIGKTREEQKQDRTARRLERQEGVKVVQSRDTQDRCKSRTVVKSKTCAGVTQLVECHLAKVDVESSNLFSRSKMKALLELRRAFLCRVLRMGNICNARLCDRESVNSQNDPTKWDIC